MSELKPCPFCGGKAKLSAKDHLFGGYNGIGQSRREYLIRAICNKCKARGKPIATGWVNCMYSHRNSAFTSEQDKDTIKIAEAKAVEAWNRRHSDD